MTKQESTETKQKILNTAALLFSQKGFDRVSVREICENVGVGKPALYYYFKDKDDLIFAILEWARELGDEMGAEVFPKDGNTMRSLEAFFFVYGLYYKKHPTLIRFFTNSQFAFLKTEIRDKYISDNLRGEIYLKELLLNGYKTKKINTNLNVSVVVTSIIGTLAHIITRAVENNESSKMVTQKINQLYDFWAELLFNQKGKK